MNFDTCLKSFKSWLLQKKYSSSTIRNYISDINKYFEFASDRDIFSSTTLQSYLSSIKNISNKDRYSSSLAKFFQFAIDQKFTTINPFKETSQLSCQEIVQAYQDFLLQQKCSPNTIKNYLVDIQQFIDWSQNQIVS